MNYSTVANRDFNGRILRSVVEEFKPKTLTKCVFPWNKNGKSCHYELSM